MRNMKHIYILPDRVPAPLTEVCFSRMGIFRVSYVSEIGHQASGWHRNLVEPKKMGLQSFLSSEFRKIGRFSSDTAMAL